MPDLKTTRRRPSYRRSLFVLALLCVITIFAVWRPLSTHECGFVMVNRLQVSDSPRHRPEPSSEALAMVLRARAAYSRSRSAHSDIRSIVEMLPSGSGYVVASDSSGISHKPAPENSFVETEWIAPSTDHLHRWQARATMFVEFAGPDHLIVRCEDGQLTLVVLAATGAQEVPLPDWQSAMCVRSCGQWAALDVAAKAVRFGRIEAGMIVESGSIDLEPHIEMNLSRGRITWRIAWCGTEHLAIAIRDREGVIFVALKDGGTIVSEPDAYLFAGRSYRMHIEDWCYCSFAENRSIIGFRSSETGEELIRKFLCRIGRERYVCSIAPDGKSMVLGVPGKWVPGAWPSFEVVAIDKGSTRVVKRLSWAEFSFDGWIRRRLGQNDPTLLPSRDYPETDT